MLLDDCKTMEESLTNQGRGAGLSDDELCAWWAAEGGVPNRSMRSVFEFVTQDEFQFIELVRTELRNRGYESRLIVVKPGSYAARADRASAYKFIVDVVLPRKERIPEKRYALAEAYARYLFRTMRRGLGKGIRGKLR